LSDVAWAQGYATRLAEAAPLEATLAKAITAPRGMLVLPRLPGPIRAELTMIATRPSGSDRRLGSAPGANTTARGLRRGSTVYVDAMLGSGDGVEAQARQAFARLGEVLTQGELEWRDVALVTVYLSDIADLPTMNAVFKETFPTDPPARVTIQVQPQATERIRIGLIAAR
jgi:2-iminobutanoate/2-iminopropanoate deaminase